MVKGMEHIFSSTATKVGRGVKSKRCILFYDFKDEDEEAVLKTKEEEYPVLAVFRRKNLFHRSYIIGDKNKLLSQAGSFANALILYCGIFRAFDMEIPKAFVQMIGMICTLIFVEKWNPKWGKQSAGYIKMKEKLDNEMRRGNICSGMGKQA